MLIMASQDEEFDDLALAKGHHHYNSLLQETGCVQPKQVAIYSSFLISHFRVNYRLMIYTPYILYQVIGVIQ